MSEIRRRADKLAQFKVATRTFGSTNGHRRRRKTELHKLIRDSAATLNEKDRRRFAALEGAGTALIIVGDFESVGRYKKLCESSGEECSGFGVQCAGQVPRAKGV